MIKRCLSCEKLLFRKYDVIAYNALDESGEQREYKAYLCRKCADDIDNENVEIDESL